MVMKAIAVYSGKAGPAHLADVPEPRPDDISEGRGVMIRLVRVSVDGTEQDINPGD